MLSIMAIFIPAIIMLTKNIFWEISRNHSLSYFLDSERQKAFGRAKSITFPRYCVECEVRPMCNGECPKNRFITTPDGEMGLNYLCNGYKYFFNHCRPFVEAISEAWKSFSKLKGEFDILISRAGGSPISDFSISVFL